MKRSIEENFWGMVDCSGDCWVWVGSKTRGGYGNFGLGQGVHRAHRFAWKLINGPIPEGLWVLHKCDNRPCVRHDHLWLGTRQENMDDMVRKGRHRVPLNEKGLFISSKLTWEAVRIIRKEYVPGNGRWHTSNKRELCKRFSVGPTTIRNVVNGSKWREKDAPWNQ